jgi:2-polyprenyl-3-methyl-5-hydroxy-6-metoxy-1,4-benzoquinol methylase
MWHEYRMPSNWYVSGEYRLTIENSLDINDYYKRHDKSVAVKLQWTGTDIFRDKIVMDVGAGGAGFLDFISTVASKTIAIEPTGHYRYAIQSKGVHDVYDYLSTVPFFGNAEGVDVITSFDVIEHVDNPGLWLRDVNNCIKPGGLFICGTPSDYPLLRKFCKDNFEPFIFQAAHPWIFTEKSLHILFKNAGFKEIHIEQKYHYGIGNFVNWLATGTAKGDIHFPEFSDTLNETFRREMVAKGLGEYFLIRAIK